MATRAAESFVYMTPEHPTTFHRSFKLHRELKMRILTSHLNRDWQIEETNMWNHAEYIDEYRELIFQTRNRELIDLVQQAYYSTDEFSIYPIVEKFPLGAVEPDPHWVFSVCIDYPNRKHAHLVQRLYSRVDPCTIPKMPDDTLFRELDAWRLLLRYRDGYNDDKKRDEEADSLRGAVHEKDRRGFIVDSDLDWTKKFPYLRLLTIIFSVRISVGYPLWQKENCGCSRLMLSRVKEPLSRTEMEWKANRIEFQFSMIGGCDENSQ
jgi:hypothetical protein